MRISELSDRSDVPVPTIKYYLREGLLPRGERTAVNQATYDDTHLRRLRLIGALTDIGGLGIAQVREVLAAVEDPRIPMHDLFGVAQRRLSAPLDVRDETAHADARRDVDVFLERLGWEVAADAPGRDELAQVLVVLRDLGFASDADVFAPYATAAWDLAEQELVRAPGGDSREGLVEWMVIGTVVLEQALVALRRLAHEAVSGAGGPGR